MRILIVGGGISGLVAATQLQRDHTVTLVERNDHLGGRIHSMKHYECGAFRIHASHKRVFALAKRLGVKLAPWSFTTVHLGMKTPSENSGKATKAKDGMSWWDLEANKGGLKLAEWKDFASGYRSSTGANSMTYPLDLDESKGWYFAPEGLSALTEALEAELACKVHLSTRLVDCEKSGKHVYKATFLSRDESKKSFSSRYDTVIFATSPVDLQTISLIKDHGLPLAHAVQWKPLHRLYAKVKGLTKAQAKRLERTKIISPTLLSQTLGCPPFHNKSQLPWLQVSYSEGQVAQFWHDLLLSFGKKALVKRLTKELQAVLSDFFETTLDISLEEVDSHYWSRAVHQWNPLFRVPPLQTLCELHPVKCPRIFFINEALSFHQGWIEGSLESTERFLEGSFDRLPLYVSPSAIPKSKGNEWVILDSRVLDVAAWKKVHPGSTKAIDNHLYEEIDNLWKIIHGSYPDAWATVLPLQVAWVSNSHGDK